MLNLVLDHSPAFVIGELLLALSLGMFAIAFANTVREKYAIQVPVAKTQGPSTRSQADFPRRGTWPGVRN
jgi:hypothetical protein